MIFFIRNWYKYFGIKELCIVFLALPLSSCTFVNSADTPSKPENPSSQSLDFKAATNKNNQKSGFEEWMQQWNVRKKGKWGVENISLVENSSNKFDKVLRVRYPAGSASPSVSRKNNVPIGGAQFFAI